MDNKIIASSPIRTIPSALDFHQVMQKLAGYTAGLDFHQTLKIYFYFNPYFSFVKVYKPSLLIFYFHTLNPLLTS